MARRFSLRLTSIATVLWYTYSIRPMEESLQMFAEEALNSSLSQNPGLTSWNRYWASFPKGAADTCDFGSAPSSPKDCVKSGNRIWPNKKWDVETLIRERSNKRPPGCSMRGKNLYWNKKGNSNYKNSKTKKFRLVCFFPDARLDAIEARNILNEKRGKGNEVCASSKLTMAAMAHAEDMAERGYLEHRATSPYPRGETPEERMASFGFTSSNVWPAVGQNIARSSSGLEDLLNSCWTDDPDSNAILFDEKWTTMGYAVYAAKQGDDPIHVLLLEDSTCEKCGCDEWSNLDE